MQSAFHVRSRCACMTVLCVFGAAAPAVAHDFFLMPSTFHPNRGDAFCVFMHVSEVFPGDSVAWRTNKVAELVTADAAGRHALEGLTPVEVDGSGETPATGIEIEAGRAGPMLVALVTTPSSIELESHDFTEYVAHEGHTEVLKFLRRRGGRDGAMREEYTRFVKLIVDVGGDGRGEGVDSAEGPRAEYVTSPMGLKIEIVPEKNPTSLTVGDTLPVRVLFDGEPCADAFVSATWKGYSTEHDAYAMQKRAGIDGRVTFPLRHGGPWLIRCTRMAPRDAGGQDAHWESFWAALTFEIPTGDDHANAEAPPEKGATP